MPFLCSVTVGGGGAAAVVTSTIRTNGANGGNTVFSSLTAFGGGGGGGARATSNLLQGGSGGGGSACAGYASCTAGAGVSGQGNAGGTGCLGGCYWGAGGGGAGAVGGSSASQGTMLEQLELDLNACRHLCGRRRHHGVGDIWQRLLHPRLHVADEHGGHLGHCVVRRRRRRYLMTLACLGRGSCCWLCNALCLVGCRRYFPKQPVLRLCRWSGRRRTRRFGYNRVRWRGNSKHWRWRRWRRIQRFVQGPRWQRRRIDFVFPSDATRFFDF